MKKLIYLSSPFTRGNKSVNVSNHLQKFFDLANRYPEVLFYAPLVWCGTSWTKNLTEEQWLDYDLRMLSRCDGVYVFGDWENSVGCRAEVAQALRLGIPVSLSETEIEEYNK